MSKKEILQFTTILSELMNSHLSLRSALEVMERMSGINKKCSVAALEINSYLSEGSRFSMALKKCQSLDFDETYTAFVCSAEKNGQLKKTVDFLSKREMQKKSLKEKITTMSIYPAFVILISFLGGILLSMFSSKLIADVSGNFDFIGYKKNVVTGFLQANIFLFSTAATLFVLLKKIVDKKIILDVFKVLDFMSESNIDLYSSLEIALLVAGKNEKIKDQIGRTMNDISMGIKLSESINNFGKNFCVFAEIAESSGNIGIVFKQICAFIESKFGRIEKICMDLINPVVMGVVGVYIIILLKKIAMPVLFNFGI